MIGIVSYEAHPHAYFIY